MLTSTVCNLPNSHNFLSDNDTFHQNKNYMPPTSTQYCPSPSIRLARTSALSSGSAPLSPHHRLLLACYPSLLLFSSQSSIPALRRGTVLLAGDILFRCPSYQLARKLQYSGFAVSPDQEHPQPRSLLTRLLTRFLIASATLARSFYLVRVTIDCRYLRPFIPHYLSFSICCPHWSPVYMTLLIQRP